MGEMIVAKSIRDANLEERELIKAINNMIAIKRALDKLELPHVYVCHSCGQPSKGLVLANLGGYGERPYDPECLRTATRHIEDKTFKDEALKEIAEQDEIYCPEERRWEPIHPITPEGNETY